MKLEEKKKLLAHLDRQAEEEADEKLRAEAESLAQDEKEQVKASERKASEADDKLRAEAQEIADAEADIVTERSGEDLSEDTLTQNARANANWPLTASEKKRVASRLLRIAKKLLE